MLHPCQALRALTLCGLAALMLIVGACSRSSSSQEERQNPLQRLALAWEESNDRERRSHIVQQFLLTFATHRDAVESTQVPEGLLQTLAVEALYGRSVYAHRGAGVRRAWKVGNFWVIQGLNLAGRQFVYDPDPDALPQLQDFQVRFDMLLHIGPSGPQILAINQLQESLGTPEVQRVP